VSLVLVALSETKFAWLAAYLIGKEVTLFLLIEDVDLNGKGDSNAHIWWRRKCGTVNIQIIVIAGDVDLDGPFATPLLACVL
jgi:hypothetical protein